MPEYTKNRARISKPLVKTEIKGGAESKVDLGDMNKALEYIYIVLYTQNEQMHLCSHTLGFAQYTISIILPSIDFDSLGFQCRIL